MEQMKLKVVLKYSLRENGVQFVMTSGDYQMPMWCAEKLVVPMVP